MTGVVVVVVVVALKNRDVAVADCCQYLIVDYKIVTGAEVTEFALKCANY